MFIMPLLLIAFTSLFFYLSAPPSFAAATATILPGQALAVGDKLVSENGRYALGFFDTSSTKSPQSTSSWHLGIWFNTVPKFASAWVANREKPIKNTTSLQLTISTDGNLVIQNRSTKSIFWSTQANVKRNGTIAMLLSNGNLILRNSSNSSHILWQSFDDPTDTLLPGAKLGFDRLTGLDRRLVSWKNRVSPASGAYCNGLDPSGADQFLLTRLDSSMSYWSSGVWNGNSFVSYPGNNTPNQASYNLTFVDNEREKYVVESLADENAVFRHVIDASGQAKGYVWYEGLQDWILAYNQPKAQCDVYAVCGPFTICNDDDLPNCICMDGFTITSPLDWELEDRTAGCLRKTPLHCITNKNTTYSTDQFASLPCVRLPKNASKVEIATSAEECAQICLNNCSCTAYSFGDEGCYILHHELINIAQLQCGGTTKNSDGETLYFRLSAQDVQSSKNNRRQTVGVVVGTGLSALGLFGLGLLLMIWRNKRKRSPRKTYGSDGGRIIAFEYTDLQRATKYFTDKLGGGSFGSVFKGFLSDSHAIAVKMLEGAYQGEKQFRAEVSSVGAIQHINLVKLVGFCCHGPKRLLVYEHMPNRSLDIHLFKDDSTILNWTTRYQIALGVARGLAYMHESCRDYIIHCDVKPENILLDALFVPKIADFGMAKILGRDFSRALTTARGTIGYLAPEWIYGVAITAKVDVYSYGMVLLEIISGRRNSDASCSSGGDLGVFFPVHAARKLLEGDIKSLVDHKLQGDVNLAEVELACKVACWCIQDEEFDRPTMGEVVQILEGQVETRMPPMPRLLQAVAGSSCSTCS
ncbi:G-type lectin S-receptor-like serine/threonine-protein kinase At2g19130 [Triticum urartu]|uniref:Receptor-like serine/threonine-protein kinase n=1 Tax=Triticum urartu TaxID=4572 RepID=A0A8R7PAV1_TRIUA|nr:G-type lectin S-receptor-like serine/threonine-protein kinase At2g19130 [Triticum urartu]